MKIAWVTYGFEEYSVAHANALCQQHEVLLVIPQSESDQLSYSIDPSIEHYGFRKPRLRQPLQQSMSIRKITKRIREFHPDVVHVQHGHLWFNFALRSLQRYPLVVTIHDPRHHAGDSDSKKTPQWWMDYGFRCADHVIVHGEALSNQVHELFGFEHDQIHVIPHVAMGKVADSETIVEDPNTVLFFGRIWDYKGLEHLIRAEPLIAKEIPDIRIVIAGEGDDFQRYYDMIGDSHRFDVHNRWISDDERARFFQRSAIVVLPYNEATQSGVVPVAYTYGRPVVATRVGALAECVYHEQTGLLVPPKDPKALADAIIRLLKDPERRHAFGKAGRQRMLEDASPSVVARQTAEVYEQAIRDRCVNTDINA